MIAPNTTLAITQMQWQALGRKARTMVRRASAPHSNFQVGAAVLSSAGEIFGGCNIENDSYSLTICAERVAIFNAVASSSRPFALLAVYIVSGEDDRIEPSGPISPCGACRQVMAQFGPKAVVSYVGTDGTRRKRPLEELLPETFSL